MARYGWVAALGMVLAAGACAPPRAGPGATEGPLAGTEWELQELNGQPAAAPTGGEPLTLEFAPDEPRASGNAGCNRFNGPYTQNGASLRLGPLASTRRACIDETFNRQETAYLQALEATTRIAIYDDLLVLYAQDRVVARLRRTDG